jgi:hypothetical protein
MTDIGSDRLGLSGDLFYAELLEAHAGLSPEGSARLNARLVLLLANQVGDIEVLRTALAKAKERFR